MQILVGNKNNIYTYAFNAGTGTLSISNVNNFPLDIASLISVYDVTAGAPFAMGPVLSWSYTYVNGLPVYSWVFGLPQLPPGAANGDTLNVILEIPQNQADNAQLQYIAGATI